MRHNTGLPFEMWFIAWLCSCTHGLPKQGAITELRPLGLACAAQVGPEGRRRGVHPLWLAHHVWV